MFEELILMYSLVFILLSYSLLVVPMLDYDTLKNFELLYVRLLMIVILVSSAYYDPIVALSAAIAFLMTHHRLQELKKEQVNNTIQKVQKKSNDIKRKINKNTEKLNKNSGNLNIVNSSGDVVSLKEQFSISDEGRPEIRDEDFNYINKQDVMNAANYFFDTEKMFEKMSSNFV